MEDITKRQKNIHHLLRYKILTFFVLCVVTLVLLLGIRNSINQYKMVHSYIYQYLQGNHELEGELSYMDRSNISGVAFVMGINDTRVTIDLNILLTNSNRLCEDVEGNLKIISYDPDSISIETGSKILDGKYQVRFINTKKGDIAPIVENYMCLENDSTQLYLKKLK